MPAKKPATPARPPRERPLTAPGRTKRDDRVLVAFDGTGSHRRWTVLLRPVLLLPHLVFSALLGIGTFIVLVLAWFGAVFTGRVPPGLADFLANALQYQSRVLGYGPLLLTDAFPRLSFADADHPIAVDTAPGPLNKVAVLFRLVLATPSALLASVAMVGAQIVGIAAWVLTLILGRLPQPIFQANASLLRYVARTYAFAYMLTAEQPKDLFRGDPPLRPRGGGFDQPEHDVPVVMQWPYSMRVVISAAAKRVLVVFIVLGALGTAGYAAGVVALAVSATDSTSSEEALRDAHDELTFALSTFNAEVRACSGATQLVCLHGADNRFAGAFETFAARASAVATSGSFDTEALLVNARTCATALRARAQSLDPAGYDAALPQVRAALVAFDRSYADLVD